MRAMMRIIELSAKMAGLVVKVVVRPWLSVVLWARSLGLGHAMAVAITVMAIVGMIWKSCWRRSVIFFVVFPGVLETTALW